MSDLTLPPYLDDETEETIRERMFSQLPSDVDHSQGSFLWDAIVPVAIEFALAKDQLKEVLRRVFFRTSFGNYLDLRAEEKGILRYQAEPAKGTVVFVGTPGTTIPAGTVVGVELDPTVQETPILYATDTGDILDDTGYAEIPVTCQVAGSIGNVPAQTIKVLVTPVSGVTEVYNPQPFFTGRDKETDEEFIDRYLWEVRRPGSSGNRADYIRWAREIPEVGGVYVQPVAEGPGTVHIYIVNSQMQPASQELIDATQNYIAPPWINTLQTESMALQGYGVSIDESQPGTPAVKMIYDSQGPGEIRLTDMQNNLQQGGVWRLLVKVKVDNNSNSVPLLRAGVWNLSVNNWAISPGGTEPGVDTFIASDCGIEYKELDVKFWWNNLDRLELRIDRLTDDTSTTVWIDSVTLRSTFSTDQGTGKAPIGARVTVLPADPVPITITASIMMDDTRTLSQIQADFTNTVTSYLSDIAMDETSNDVSYAKIGALLLSTPGVKDYTSLLVNGGTSNVEVSYNQVAMLQEVTFIEWL